MKNKIITQCSYCKKYKNPHTGEWQIEKPVEAVEGIDGNISHGACSECLEKELKKIDEI